MRRASRSLPQWQKCKTRAGTANIWAPYATAALGWVDNYAKIDPRKMLTGTLRYAYVLWEEVNGRQWTLRPC